MNFTFSEDYNNDMHAHIDNLFNEYKAKITSRNTRLQASDLIIEHYVEHTGERPDSTALERLGTLLLLDELTDTDRMKVRNNEYPFLSDDQLRRRYDEEVSLKWAQDVAIDGVDYRVKTRDSNRKFREVTGQFD